MFGGDISSFSIATSFCSPFASAFAKFAWYFGSLFAEPGRTPYEPPQSSPGSVEISHASLPLYGQISNVVIALFRFASPARLMCGMP